MCTLNYADLTMNNNLKNKSTVVRIDKQNISKKLHLILTIQPSDINVLKVKRRAM